MTSRGSALALLTSLILLVPGRAAAYTPLAYSSGAAGHEQVAYLDWPQIRAGQPIPFHISRAGTPDIGISAADPAIDAFEALTLAFQPWEQVPGVPLRFALSPTDTDAWGFDGENVIFFADLGPVGYGAVTLITYDNTTGAVLDVDIHMNDHDTRWRTSGNDASGEPLPCPCEGDDAGARYTNDVQGIATHEIGHALGLDHSAIGRRDQAGTPTMYPLGIWDVPGDGARPPNSRFRSLEPDDLLGLEMLYPPASAAAAPGGTLTGVVHDRFDRPVFGASVVAKNLQTGVEVGAMSGTLKGAFQKDRFTLAGLPPGSYQVRAEPVDGSAPGYVGLWNFGGIARSLFSSNGAEAVDLPVTYEHFAYAPDEAAPVLLAAGETREIVFRPLATLEPTPRLIRPARAFEFKGRINTDVTGPLRAASFVYTIDGSATETRTDLPISGADFAAQVPRLASGSVVEGFVEVETEAGANYHTLPSKLQVGLSGEPLIFTSETGGGRISAVDSRTFFEVDDSRAEFSYPLGMSMHAAGNGVYVTDYGTDAVSFVPLFAEHLPPTSPRSFDTDGDGLTNALEALFDTNPANPDSDGDLVLDGAELSELAYVHPSSGASFFDVMGGTVAADGPTPLGASRAGLALWSVTEARWDTPVMALTPTGRFHMRLPAGKTYRLSYFDARTGLPLANTASWNGTSGQALDGGVTALALSPPIPAVRDSGSNPLDALDGAPGIFLPSSIIPLEPGAKPYGAALGGPGRRYLFVTGSGSNAVYKIDTRTNSVVGRGAVGHFPKGIAVTPDGTKVYVAVVDEAEVTVLDAGTLLISGTIPMPGPPDSLSITPDGSRVIVTCGGSSDIVLIDTVSNTIEQSLPSGVRDLAFLSPVSASGGLALAGSFKTGESRMVLVDPLSGSLEVVPLGPAVGTTSGVALNPDGRRGYAIDYFDSELVEFDVHSGAILRSHAFDGADIRDILIVPAPRSSPPLRRRWRALRLRP